MTIADSCNSSITATTKRATCRCGSHPSTDGGSRKPVWRPDTSLFQERKNRAGSWKLSSDLIDSVSQILEQKAAWQIRGETNASANHNTDGDLIVQRTVDPKSILIIGSDSQFSGTAKEQAIKLRTFELFRRDSRNIEILTYDELCERAKFIVGHSEPRGLEAKPEEEAEIFW